MSWRNCHGRQRGKQPNDTGNVPERSRNVHYDMRGNWVCRFWHYDGTVLSKMTPTLRYKRQRYAEDQFQMALVQHIELLKVPGVVYWHTVNSAKLGGSRTRSGVPLAAIRAKRMGLRAGVSDLVFLRPDGIMFTLELKSKGGYPTLEQYHFMDEINAAGGYAAWTDDLDRALLILEAWQLIRPGNQARLPLAG